MLDHQPRRRTTSGLVLLLVGLLYLAGTVAEPLVHAYAGGGEGRTLVLIEGGAPGSDPSEPAGPHGEVQCLLCKVTAPLVLAGDAAVVAHQLTEVRSLFVLFRCSRAPSAAASPPSRAPPFA